MSPSKKVRGVSIESFRAQSKWIGSGEGDNVNLGKPEKVIILTIIGVFMLPSIGLLSALVQPIIREEAVEISKNSELVKKGLAEAHSFSVDAVYYNSSMVERMKIGHNREIYEHVPEGHGVWDVIWDINKDVGGYFIIVIIDAETGTIIHETKGIEFG